LRSARHAGTERLQEIPGLVPVLSVQPDACTFAERCPAADSECLATKPAGIRRKATYLNLPPPSAPSPTGAPTT